MRNALFLVVLSAATSGCAARPVAPTTPLHYACDGADVVRAGDELTVSSATAGDMRRGWADAEGEHFVLWPRATTESSATEYVIPADRHLDAVARVWDTTQGTSPADWRLKTKGACRVRGGYSDVLAVFAGGGTLEDVATKLELVDSNQARTLVRDAMIALQRRYYATR